MLIEVLLFNQIVSIAVFTVTIRLSAADEVKKNLSGVVGGNITLPDPLLEFGLLLVERKNIALVNDGKLQIVEEIYMNKLHWNRISGLFTITDLQKNDSGIYTIDSKKRRVFIGSYNLTVYGELHFLITVQYIIHRRYYSMFSPKSGWCFSLQHQWMFAKKI